MVTTVVFGGTKGIGRAIVDRRAALGDSVWAIYNRDQAAAEECATELASTGATIRVSRCDIGDAEDVRRLAQHVERAEGQVDLLVNSAVHAVRGELTELDDAELGRAVAVNGLGTLWMVRSFRPLLGDGATVVVLSSRGSKVVVDGYGPVGCPKAMAEAAIRYLAVELGGQGVSLHVLSPSTLDTQALRTMVDNADERLHQAAERNPAGRALRFEDVADAIDVLASPSLRMLTGREVVLDGGVYLRS